MKKIFTLLFAACVVAVMNAEVLTVAQAYEIGMALDSEATSETEYTVEGYVINAGSFFYDRKYQSWYMADEADATASDFWAYNCYPIEGTDTLKVLNGDKVLLVGNLRKYWDGNKFIIEMRRANASFITKVEGSHVFNMNAEPISVAQAIKIAKTLDDRTYSEKLYEITGYVTAMSGSEADGGWARWSNQRFWIVDDKDSEAQTIADGAFEVYRGVASEEVHVGDKISIIAQLWRSGETLQTSTGRVTILDEENPTPVPELPEGVISCDSAVALAASFEDPIEVKATTTGPEVKVRGYVTYAYNASERDGVVHQSVWIASTEDGNPVIQGAYLVIASLDEVVVVGDYVQLRGTLAKYLKEGKNGNPNEVVIEVINGTMQKEPFLPDIIVNASPEYAGSVPVNENVLTAIPNYGYHFTQWSDGVTDNPRTIELTKDTTFTAVFAKNPTITYVCDLQMGRVQGPIILAYDTVGEITFTAIPNYGYHFTQWSDGITDNPRTFTITQDTTFTAEFKLARTGTCGTDLALMWVYEPEEKVLTITGEGAFNENMQCGIEARTALQKIVFADGVTSIGESAFANCATLQTLVLSKDVKKINENAFYNCENLTAIYNYRPTPTNIYANTFSGVDKFDCILYVPDGSVDMYKSDGSNWKDFYFIESMASAGDEYTVTYIGKEEEILDSEKIKLHLPEAPEIVGFTFLGWRPEASFVESNTIVIEAVYEANEPTSAPEVYTNPTNSAQKLIRDGNVYILTSDKTYTITGQAVK